MNDPRQILVVSYPVYKNMRNTTSRANSGTNGLAIGSTTPAEQHHLLMKTNSAVVVFLHWWKP